MEQDILSEALKYHQAGRLAEAEQLYRQLLVIDPDHADTLHLLGVLSRQVGRPDVAVELIEKAIRLKGDVPAFYNNLATALEDQGKFVDALRTYERALAIKPDYAAARVNIGNVQRGLGNMEDAIAHYNGAIAANPNLATAHSNLGAALKAQGNLSEAIAHYEKALAIDPTHAPAHLNLGNALKEQSRLEEAASHCRKAIELNPNSAESQNSLGTVLSAQGRLGDAVTQYECALALNPNYVEARSNLSNALAAQGKLGEASVQGRLATEAKGADADAHYNHALVRLVLGDFEQGWREYEWRWLRNDIKPHGFDGPQWNGNDLTSETLLLHCEQGLGDSIQFVRYAGIIKKDRSRVLLLCPPSLSSLFKRVEGIDEVFSDPNKIPTYDFQAPLMSLPFLLNTRLETIPACVPYLSPQEALASQWYEHLKSLSGVKVGIVWRGNPAHKNDRNRSMKAAEYGSFLDHPGISVVNLQIDAKPEEISALALKGPFLNAAPDLRSFEDTAALVATLDLVISVDTSVCHLAGALGTPVWTLLPYAPDWRWLLHRDDSPWYPTMRLFRQLRIGDWQSAITKVRTDLQKLVQGEPRS